MDLDWASVLGQQTKLNYNNQFWLISGHCFQLSTNQLADGLNSK
jgi:hypothetical protein